MSVDTESTLDVCVGQVIWPREWEGPRSDQQHRTLMELVRQAGDGVILDCSLVEVGTSELVSLLMRVRNQAQKMGKEIILINVPDTLSELIQICNLRSVLPAAKDASTAKEMVRDRLSGKGTWRDWISSFLRK